MPEPKSNMQRIQPWWDKAIGGEWLHPVHDMNMSPEDYQLIRDKGVGALQKNEFEKFKLLEEWDRRDNEKKAEEIVERSPPPTDTPVPSPSPTPTPDPYADPLMREILGIIGKNKYVDDQNNPFAPKN